jgi:hypothetical protein
LTKKLSLGPVPKSESVKLTLMVSTELRENLDLYAALHSEMNGTPVDAATLAPLMLETFMARDKGFRAARSGRARASGQPTRVLDKAG